MNRQFPKEYLEQLNAHIASVSRELQEIKTYTDLVEDMKKQLDNCCLSVAALQQEVEKAAEEEIWPATGEMGYTVDFTGKVVQIQFHPANTWLVEMGLFFATENDAIRWKDAMKVVQKLRRQPGRSREGFGIEGSVGVNGDLCVQISDTIGFGGVVFATLLDAQKAVAAVGHDNLADAFAYFATNG